MREAIFAAITVPVSAQTAKGRADAVPASEQVAVHAIALGALLTEALSVLSPAERQLLSDWLDRLATAKNQT
jgi:hypothetical protein